MHLRNGRPECSMRLLKNHLWGKIGLQAEELSLLHCLIGVVSFILLGVLVKLWEFESSRSSNIVKEISGVGSIATLNQQLHGHEIKIKH